MSYKFNPFTGTLDYFDTDGGSSTPSPNITETKTASETISALKLVTAIDATQVEVAEKDNYPNSKVLGLALTAANIGEQVEVLLFGKHTDASFTFTLNEPLFLTSAGVISSIAPTTEFSVNIGHSLGAGAIFIDIQEQIELQ